jgi:hypothetical protein
MCGGDLYPFFPLERINTIYIFIITLPSVPLFHTPGKGRTKKAVDFFFALVMIADMLIHPKKFGAFIHRHFGLLNG